MIQHKMNLQAQHILQHTKSREENPNPMPATLLAFLAIVSWASLATMESFWHHLPTFYILGITFLNWWQPGLIPKTRLASILAYVSFGNFWTLWLSLFSFQRLSPHFSVRSDIGKLSLAHAFGIFFGLAFTRYVIA